MLIKSEYDIQFHLPQPTPMVAMLHVHPSLESRLITPDAVTLEHIGPTSGYEGATRGPVEEYFDSFGNRCARFMAPQGAIRLTGTSILNANDFQDLQGFGLPQTPVEQ